MSAILVRVLGLLKAIDEAGYCVFVEYSGHVKWLDIRVSKPMPDYSSTMYNSTAIDMTKPRLLYAECERLKKLCKKLNIEAIL